jgi:hypothetical protein
MAYKSVIGYLSTINNSFPSGITTTSTPSAVNNIVTNDLSCNSIECADITIDEIDVARLIATDISCNNITCTSLGDSQPFTGSVVDLESDGTTATLMTMSLVKGFYVLNSTINFNLILGLPDTSCNLYYVDVILADSHVQYNLNNFIFGNELTTFSFAEGTFKATYNVAFEVITSGAVSFGIRALYYEGSGAPNELQVTSTNGYITKVW